MMLHHSLGEEEASIALILDSGRFAKFPNSVSGNGNYWLGNAKQVALLCGFIKAHLRAENTALY